MNIVSFEEAGAVAKLRYVNIGDMTVIMADLDNGDFNLSYHLSSLTDEDLGTHWERLKVQEDEARIKREEKIKQLRAEEEAREAKRVKFIEDNGADDIPF